MLLRQLFDSDTCTFTYLLAPKMSDEAIIIDPVKSKTKEYLQLINELDLSLVAAIDTHVHADHITALGLLRKETQCETIMGAESKTDSLSIKIKDGEFIHFGSLKLKAIYTPGHTSDSYSFLIDNYVFTGDTLLIRGTGRTDFQGGNPAAQYDSLFNKLLALSDETIVYPGHDYRGQTSSTIWEEKHFNPRLQVTSVKEYTEIMANLNLPSPKYMDVAVPANLSCGV